MAVQVYPRHQPAPAAPSLGPKVHVVVVGHGPTGHALVQNLLEQRERDLSITVLCEEPSFSTSKGSQKPLENPPRS